MSASWEKVFSSDAKIGYFAQRSVFQAALDKHQLIVPAKTMGQMRQVITSSTLNGFLQAFFAVLALIVVASAIPVWIRASTLGGLPTTEVPGQPLHLVAAAEIFATAQEKEAIREYDAAQRELATSGRPR